MAWNCNLLVHFLFRCVLKLVGQLAHNGFIRPTHTRVLTIIAVSVLIIALTGT